MSQVTRTTRTATATRRARGNPALSDDLPSRLTIPENPPRVPRRPPSKGNKRETLADIAKRIPVDVMRTYFNYPLRTAAEAMHISVTTLKRLCRRHGVKRWPHRQISGINRALNDLQAQHNAASETEMSAVKEQLLQLHRRRDVIIELAFESDEESGRKTFGLEAASVVAHKRNGRGRTGADGNSSPSSSTTSSTRLQTPPVPDCPSMMPDSPRSAESLEEAKTTVWWQHGPPEGPQGVPGSCTTEVELGPPLVVSCPLSRRIGQRTNKSATIAGLARVEGSMAKLSEGVTKLSAASVNGQQRRQASESSRSLPGPRSVNAISPSSQLDSSVLQCEDVSSASARRCDTSSIMSSGGVGVGSGRSRVSTAAAAARERISMPNIARPPLNSDQHIDDFAALGDLLFGPDDAAPEHRGNFDSVRNAGTIGACTSGVGTRGASLNSTWAHNNTMPPLSLGTFAQDGGFVGSSSITHDPVFLNGGSPATSWASVAGERNPWSSTSFL